MKGEAMELRVEDYSLGYKRERLVPVFRDEAGKFYWDEECTTALRPGEVTTDGFNRGLAWGTFDYATQTHSAGWGGQ